MCAAAGGDCFARHRLRGSGSPEDAGEARQGGEVSRKSLFGGSSATRLSAGPLPIEVYPNPSTTAPVTTLPDSLGTYRGMKKQSIVYFIPKWARSFSFSLQKLS